MFENIRADLRAYAGDWGAQGFWVMLVYRFGRWRYGVRPAPLRKLLSFLYKVLFKFVQIITGIELPCEVPVGRNFVIDHFGGIIISGYAQFGDDCRIRNGVVVGLKNVNEPIAPVIGNNVDIGTGAKILGNIRIGNNVVIGANAVVLTDVPDNCVAVGVPAIIKARLIEAGNARERHVGVVVIGRNEGPRLERCLASLIGAAQKIVYVDSGSTDGSVQMARRLGVEVVELDMTMPFTAARARNEGFARLQHVLPSMRHVQFVDGDCEVVAELVAPCPGLSGCASRGGGGVWTAPRAFSPAFDLQPHV